MGGGIGAGDEDVVNVDKHKRPRWGAEGPEVPILEIQWREMWQASTCPEKWPMFSTGYLSSAVARLRRRKSPQGRQEPSFFLTRWSGKDEELEERHTMPAASQLLKIRLAASKPLKQVVTGRLKVSRKCSMV